MKKHFYIVLFIFFTAVVLSLPLLKPGFYLIHDDQQIARLFLFDQALKAGQFPVRWVDDLGFGFGYPLFIFYPPFVYLLGEAFHLLGFGFIDSIKLVFFFSIFASGLAMYVLVKEFWGKLPGIISALFYMLVPYRAIDVYIRGALAESFSFVWLPLIIWSLYNLQRTGRTFYIYISAVFLALLMITHNLIFLPFMLILLFYLLFLFLNSQAKRLFTFHLSLITLLAAGLSAFFWIPAILEKRFTIVDQLLLVSLADYNIHFVYPQQLWNSLWGFGGSAEGLADGISFKIGKLHILVSLAAFVLVIAHIFKSRNINRQLPVPLKSQHEPSTNSSEKANAKINGINCQLSIVFFVLFLFSAFMTIFYSKFIWDLIVPLGYLQFPWRFLIFTAFFGSILSGALIYLLKLPILRLIGGILLVILLFIPNFKLFKPQSFRLDLTNEVATSKQLINWDISQSSFEYVPNGVELKKSKLGTNVVNIEKSEIPKEKVEIVSGDAQIADLKTVPSQINFTINAKAKSQARINIFNFPGWQAKVDQVRVSIKDSNPLKLITLDIPTGVHNIEVKFQNTRVRSSANLITLASFIILFVLVVKRWKIRVTR